MFISQREALYQMGHFDEQIAAADRAARERLRDQQPKKLNDNPDGAGGGSKRLLVHRLANYDAAQAKAAGPHFEKQWRAHRAGRADAAAASPMPQPTQPAPRSTAASLPPGPTAAERAVLEGQRQRRIAAEAARKKAAAREAAIQQQATIDAGWRGAHARASGKPLVDVKPAPAAKDSNFGWAKAHAKVARQFGRGATN